MQKHTDPETLKKFSRDASICQVIPREVVVPESLEDLCTLVKESTDTLTARAGGTCMSGGPLNEGIIVSMTNLSSILSYNEEKQTLWVQGGTWYRDIEVFLKEKNRMFAPFTSSKDTCAIGGMIGNNASGEESIRHGATRENVRAVRMVLHNGSEYEFGPLSNQMFEEKKTLNTLEGEIYRALDALYHKHKILIETSKPHTTKNTAGYALDTIFDAEKQEWNLAKLIVGSQGTLGIVSAAELYTTPIMPYHALYALPIDSFRNIPDVLDVVFKGKPESTELYDQTTLRLSCKEDTVIGTHLAHLLQHKAVLLVEYAENSIDELKKQQEIFETNAKEKQVAYEYVADEAVEKSHWTTRRKSYGLFSQYAHKGRVVPIIEDISVHMSNLNTLFDAIEIIMNRYGYEYVFHGHIGDGSIRVFPLIDFSQENAKDRLINMSEEIFAVVAENKGTIATDHGDGIVRTPFLSMMYPKELLTIFTEVKKIFDPHNRFNPGKKVSITKEYFKDHIDTAQ